MSTNEKSLVVRQSNQLIEASYKIASVGEGRFIRMLIAQINPNDEDFKTYRISVADFARFFGLSKESNSVYELIKKSADELAGRRIMLEQNGNWLRLNWLSYAEYKKGSGYIEVRFDKALKPYLLGLKGYFTQYELDEIINFKSGYAMRIFEFLKKEEFKADNRGYFKRIFGYDELRELLGIEKREYPLFADVRRYVIESSIKEINANPDIKVTHVEYPKTGRKVSHVVFYCEKAKQLQLNIDEPLPKIEEIKTKKDLPEDVRELLSLGIDEATAYKWRKKYGVKRLTRNLAYTRAMQNAGKIRDSITGFLARAIADNLGSAWEEEERQRRERHRAHQQAQMAKEAEERQKINEQLAWIESRFSTFNALPEERKTAIRQAYAATLSDITRPSFEKEAEQALMHRMRFAQFFESHEGDM